MLKTWIVQSKNESTADNQRKTNPIHHCEQATTNDPAPHIYTHHYWSLLMKQIVSEIGRKLTKTSPPPKFIVPTIIENLLQPFQESKDLNQEEIDVCKGNILLKWHRWRKFNFKDPSEEQVNKFYVEIGQTGKFGNVILTLF